MNDLLEQLRQRKVARVALIYCAAMFALLEFADIAFPRLGFNDVAIDRVLVLGLLGLPIALILAWFIDLNPAADPSTVSIRWTTPATIASAAALFLIGVGAGVLFDSESEAPLEPTAAPKILVLPFSSLDPDPARRFFADGLSDDISSKLGKFKGFQVIPASVTHDLEASSPDALGRQLNARYVISGTVRQQGDRIRITARLIDVQSSAQLWAETFNGESTAASLFDLQAHVARRVVVSIADPTGVIRMVESNALISRPTDSLQAYECVLRAHAYLRIHDNETHALAKDCLIRAVQIDPGYAEAWGQLAYLYREELQHNRPSQTPDSLEKASAALDRALELDRNHPRVAFAQAMVAFSSGDTIAGTAHARRAASLNPNDASILGTLGIYLVQMGEIDEAEKLGEQVLEMHPTPPFWIHMIFATAHYLRGNFQDALQAVARWDQPEDVQWHYHRVAALAELGRTEQATQAAREMRSQFPQFSADPATEINKYMFVSTTREPFLRSLAKAGLVSSP